MNELCDPVTGRSLRLCDLLRGPQGKRRDDQHLKRQRDREVIGKIREEVHKALSPEFSRNDNGKHRHHERHQDYHAEPQHKHLIHFLVAG